MMSLHIKWCYCKWPWVIPTTPDDSSQNDDYFCILGLVSYLWSGWSCRLQILYAGRPSQKLAWDNVTKSPQTGVVKIMWPINVKIAITVQPKHGCDVNYLRWKYYWKPGLPFPIIFIQRLTLLRLECNSMFYLYYMSIRALFISLWVYSDMLV